MRGYLVLLLGFVALTEGSVTNESLIDIASRACQYSSFCSRDAVLTVPEGNDKASCCYPCSCSVECLEFNNCCPDYKPPGNLPTNPKTIPCKQASYKENTGGKFYFIIDECPDGLQNTDMALKCTGSKLNTISEITIIWSPSKRRIYQNRFCAICHGVDDLVPWQPFLDGCTPFWPLDNLAAALATQSPSCEIYFEPSFDPSVLEHLTCGDPRDIIDSCKVPDVPLRQDLVLQEACDAGPYLPYLHYDGVGSPFIFYNLLLSKQVRAYKNVFCFLCNNVPQSGHPLCSPLSSLTTNGRDSLFLPLKIMLNLQLLQATRPRVCASDEMFDGLTGRCRKIHCQDFDVAIDGTCVSQIVKTNGLPVQVAFKLTPSTPPSVDIPRTLFYDRRKMFFNEMLDAVTALLDVLLNRGCGQCQTMLYEELDPITEALVAFYVEVVLHTSDSCSALDIREHRNTLEEAIEIKIPVEKQSLKFKTQIHFEGHNKSGFEDFARLYTVCDILRLNVKDDFFCPYIEMDLADYALALDQGVIEGNTTFCSSYSCDSATAIKRICLPDYKNPEVSYQTQSRLGDALNISGIVSFVFTVLSVLSLLATIFTYSCFRSLSKLPSGIILLLSVNLLLSQLLYAVGLGRTEFHWLCFGFGVAIHYFVLAYVFTMNAYMTVVYKSLRFSCLPEIGINFFTSVYILPLLFIGVNIGVSLQTSVGTYYGYGDEYCFISSADMRRYVFAVPILLTVLCNCCLYGLTVKHIHFSTERLPPDIQERRSNQWVYLRLSMLTGISWLFGFIHEVSGDPFSEYCFIVFNAGQGIFLMIGFVCKRTVYALYKQSLERILAKST